jgi:hypothetical protein
MVPRMHHIERRNRRSDQQLTMKIKKFESTASRRVGRRQRNGAGSIRRGTPIGTNKAAGSAAARTIQAWSNGSGQDQNRATGGRAEERNARCARGLPTRASVRGRYAGRAPCCSASWTIAALLGFGYKGLNRRRVIRGAGPRGPVRSTGRR